jgi:D-alanyl-D-alanine carboxypeptidase (penicillin-binding protein 5/6)
LRKRILGMLTWLLVCVFVISSLNRPVHAEPLPFNVQAKSAILMDYDTGTILYEKNPHEKLPVASLTKIMTILLALEAIDEGRLKLDDKVVISEYAASMGGSQVFLSPGEELTVDALLKAIVVASANDASVAIGEKIAGANEVFVQRMNDRARALGMKNTNFVNSTGLPAENGYSTAYDVAIMSRALLNHPLFFRWSTIWTDTLEECKNKTDLANTNRLVRFYDGADGIKTGSTNDAKYCISATAKRGNLRLLSIILGAPSTQVRFAEAGKLMDYGFANYESVPILKKGQVIQKDVYVNGGKESIVNGIASKDIAFLIKSGASREFDKTIEMDENIKAPLTAGEKIGTLTITQNGKVMESMDIVADREVKKANIFDYFVKIFNSWIRK